MFQWQKQFVDSIGYDKLQQFASGSAEEFPSDDFEIGRVAMTLTPSVSASSSETSPT